VTGPAVDLRRVTASELLGQLRRREISSRELLDLHVEQLEQHNDAINAVVSLDVERARVQARVIDQQLARGRLVGPLHGLPMTVKDTFETEGLRTVAGWEPLRNHVPSRDAVAVTRLKRAGAVVFGKTNTPTLASDWQTFNDVFGTTNNPWDVTLTPGGSSGGSAAALCAGLTPLELGSDIAGSIRVPAALCGVAGHKPTFGVVPQRGHIPGPPGSRSEVDLAVVGPMARCVADLTLSLDVIAGPVAPLDAAWILQLPPPSRTDPVAWRLASLVGTTDLVVSGDVNDVLNTALENLTAAGWHIDHDARLPVEHDELVELFTTLLLPAVGQNRRLTHAAWLAANERRWQLMDEIAAFFLDYDAVLMPAFATVAFPHDHGDAEQRTLSIDGGEVRYLQTARACAALATTLHLPATVVPVGLTSTTPRLPVGLQIVGPYLADRTTLRVAGAVEEVVGRFPLA